MYYYSKSTGGFYVVEVHGDNMPDDVVQIDDSRHAVLMTAQSGGKLIVPNASGWPIAIDPPKYVPQSVSMYQARAQLIEDDLMSGVTAAFNVMPEGKDKAKALAAWEYAQNVERNSPFTKMMQVALELSESEMDGLFTRAALQS